MIRATPTIVVLTLVAAISACSGAQAVRVSDEHVAQQRGDVYAAYVRARLARYQDDLATAITEARRAVELAPGEAELVVTLGELLRLDGRLDEAIEVLEGGIDGLREPLPLYLELATVHEERGDVWAADEVYEHATLAFPDSFDVYRERAELFARQGDPARAAAILSDYVTRQPDDPEAWRAISSQYEAAGDAEAALQAIQTASRLEPQVEDDFVPRIRLARVTGDYGLGREVAHECFRVFRQNVACRVELVRLLDEMPLDGDAREAEVFETLQTLGRYIGADLRRLRYVEAVLARDLDDRRALVFMAAVAQDRPRNTQIQTRAAWAAYRVDDEELACQFMERVLEVNSRAADALNFIGYSYAERGIRLDEAEELVRRALEVRPEDGNIQDSLGWVYYRAGRFADAIVWLERAVENIPDSAVLRDHLADAYRAAGDVTSALKQYTLARELADDELRQVIQSKIEELEGVVDVSDRER